MAALSEVAACLPAVGRWIKWTKNGQEFKCEILGYDLVEGYETGCLINKFKNLPPQDVVSYNQQYRIWPPSTHVTYTDGTEDDLEQEELERYGWTYCEAPALDQLEKARYDQLNKDLGNRSCAFCGCSNKKLQICTGCHEQYYCNATCQTAGWARHKDTCKHQRIVGKNIPRYPMAHVSNEVKERQMKIQTDHNQLLQEALSGNFTVELLARYHSDTPPVRNPKSGSDVENGKRYKVVINNKDFMFKWMGLEISEHSIHKNGPTACCTLLFMAEMDRNGHIWGGLNHLASSGDETFWYMLINFNTFGTVAPFHGPCFCNPYNRESESDRKGRKLKEKWDRIFKRAKADGKDVQCMFSDTEEGCHNYNECPYKHDVEIDEEKEKVEEKEQEETKNKKKDKHEEVVLRPGAPKGIKPEHDAVDITSTNRMDVCILKEMKVEGKCVDDDIPWEGANQLNPNEKVQYAKIFKEEGTSYFKNNEFKKATAKYQKVVDFLSIDGEDEEYCGPDKKERKDLLRSCQLNLSLCYIKLGKWTEAKDTCTKVIEGKSDNIVKAWCRRGEANFCLRDFDNAKADFEKTLKLEPENKEAKNKLVLCQQAQAVKARKDQENKMFSNIFKRVNMMEGENFGVKKDSEVSKMDATDAKLTSGNSQRSVDSVLFVDVKGFQIADWMGDKLLGEPLEGITGPHGDSRARKAWQGLKIDRCSKAWDCVRKISSGRYKAIVIVDLSHNQEPFEEELGRVLQSFVRAGGAVAFPTSEGLQLAATLERLFNTTWEPSNYYRSMWDVSRENSDTVTEFFGNVSELQDLPFSAKVASVKNVPQHEQCFRIMPGAKTQSIVFFMAGQDVGPDDVCVAVHKYGNGSIAFFGDVNCETETVQLVAAYVRTRDGSSN